MSRSANDEQSETDPGWTRARHQLFGMIMEGRSFSGRERNCCFLNTRKKRFATISAVSGLDFPDDGRCIAVTDWDRDGDQDMWISNRNAPRLRFMRNDTPSKNHFIALRLVGNGSSTNRDAIGTRVEVVLTRPTSTGQASGRALSLASSPSAESSTVESYRLATTLRAGEGFLSQSSKWLHFGLGAATSVDRVVVHWPGGTSQSFIGLQADRRYRLSQGQVNAEPVASTGNPTSVTSTETELPAESSAARVVLSTRVPMPSLEYSTPLGDDVVERFHSQSPALVNLWASWCRPCVDELAAFSASQQRLESAGLQVISLSVDKLGEKTTSTTDIEAFLQRIGYPFSWGYLDVAQMDRLQELNNQFFFLRQPMPLPSSLLIDGDGRLSVIYKGPVSVEQVLDDVLLSSGGYQQSTEQAACVPGRALNHPRADEIANRTELQTRYRVAAWLEETGRYEDALKHFRELAEGNESWALPQRHLAKLYLDQNKLATAARFAAHALELDPKNAASHNTMGLIRSRQGDQISAESHFRQSIKLDSKLAGAHNNLGIVLAMQGKIAAAGECFERAIQIDDQFAKAHANLGNVHAARRDVKQAIKHYRRAIELDPNDVEPYNNLGTMFGRLGDLDQAIDNYRQALRLDPKNQNTRRNLDRALELSNSRQPRRATE